MARQPNVLRVIHLAASHDMARAILGRLSTDDLQVVSDHIKNGTLMRALQPLKDEPNNQNAVARMKPDLARVVSKLPDAQLNDLRTNLQSLKVDGNNAMVCPCA